ncbi:hypothetical protein SAMN02927921_03964 [Sinomicrobium oceani]|uniref:Membrane domain of glycerophosphoryl diester phosphodiesterase n=1 Tax=Sinomicrobium oceani TaxID=1150368 RepID=A0A1K1RTI4_9FLAO|nr:hypothetical protein [Sinomicrobium oceani]SFW75133.1 hypothetical protein SAMN02927921_03964 [Sinomicrobium oceani]
MIQLYKKRDFGELFSDTFAFIRQNGGHFFKNYFLINGAFILILMAIMYVFVKVYSALMTSSLTPGGGAPDHAIENYLNDNAILVFLFFCLFLAIAVFVGFITYMYTPIYMLLCARHSSNAFGTRDIIKEMTGKTGKLIVFILASVVLSMAVFLGAGIAMFILMITFIGIFFIPVIIAAITLMYNNALMEYLNSRKGVFECFSYGFQLIFKNLWTSVGCVALFYLMVQVVQGAIIIIPYIAGIFSILINPSALENNTEESVALIFTIMMFVYMLAFLISLLGNTIIQINQGIIYFTLKEETENINTTSVIDQIGQSQH